MTMNRPVKRVMIVDDHALVRKGVRSLIETRPCYEVVGEASDGFDAIAVAVQSRPDIAVVDYSLPGKNGLALAQSFRDHLPGLKVIIFTLCEREGLMIDLVRAGVRGFVLKSEPEDHLLQALDAVSLNRTYFPETTPEILLHSLQKPSPSSKSSLTSREREVIQLIAEGRLNKQVAHSLRISIKTVETHRSAAMHKLKLRNAADLVRFAIRNQLVEA